MDKTHKLFKTMQHARFLYENRSKIKKDKYTGLRPVTDGVTVYSLEPEHPMRGNTVACDVDTINRELEVLQIKDRKNPAAEGFREDEVQVRFCRGMIDEEEQFEGIKFVTAEFVLENSNKRIDVLGVKDDTLYIFELKRKRETNVFIQMEEYREELCSKYEGLYGEILKYYPEMEGRNIKNFVATAVMPWAENMRLTNNNMWLYEENFNENIVFHKYKK